MSISDRLKKIEQRLAERKSSETFTPYQLLLWTWKYVIHPDPSSADCIRMIIRQIVRTRDESALLFLRELANNHDIDPLEFALDDE